MDFTYVDAITMTLYPNPYFYYHVFSFNLVNGTAC